MKDLDYFFKDFNLKPNNKAIYEIAFTHSSFNFDAKTSHKDYERLEFMGDSFLNFVVADLAYNLRSDLDQGEMTKLRSTLVQQQGLTKLAKKYNLKDYIRVGKSLQNQDLEKMPHLLEDIFEAVIGAMYVDQGLNKTYDFVRNLFFDEVKNFSTEQLHDYKSTLQELLQGETRQTVTYKVLDEIGPQHDKTFIVEACYGNIILGKGKGKSKKEAEQNAAKEALKKGVVL